MPTPSLSVSSSAASAVEAAPRTAATASPAAHPALTALHAALDAAAHLEPCLRNLSDAAEKTVSPAASASASAPLNPPVLATYVLADVDERDWAVLTKQLRLLVDATHPDSDLDMPAASSGATHGEKRGLPCHVDGRAAVLAWEALSASSPTAATVMETASTSPSQQHQPLQSGGDVTRLFCFLSRLADAFAVITNTPDDKAARLPATSKAQLHAEDLLEPLLFYGCAVASNCASALSTSGHSRQHRKTSEAATSASAGVNFPSPAAAEERSSVALLGGTAVWPFVLAVTRLYQADKRILHLLLSVVANMVSWPALTVTEETTAFLYRLIFPVYTSTAMVAAWVTMLCNLTAVHGEKVVPTLLRLGVVADVQRMSLAVAPGESATTERLVVQSVQLLSNIAACVF